MNKYYTFDKNGDIAYDSEESICDEMFKKRLSEESELYNMNKDAYDKILKKKLSEVSDDENTRIGLLLLEQYGYIGDLYKFHETSQTVDDFERIFGRKPKITDYRYTSIKDDPSESNVEELNSELLREICYKRHMVDEDPRFSDMLRFPYMKYSSSKKANIPIEDRNDLILFLIQEKFPYIIGWDDLSLEFAREFGKLPDDKEAADEKCRKIGTKYPELVPFLSAYKQYDLIHKYYNKDKKERNNMEFYTSKELGILNPFIDKESTSDASVSEEPHDRIMWIETQQIEGKDFIVVKDTLTNKDYLIISGTRSTTVTPL